MEAHQVQLKDREVIDCHGEKVGKVSDVLFDESVPGSYEPRGVVGFA